LQMYLACVLKPCIND